MSGVISQTSYLIQTTYNRINRSLSDGLRLIKTHSRPFMLIEIGYWSTTLIAAALVYKYPKLQFDALAKTDKDLEYYRIGKQATAAYDSQAGSIPKAFVITLGVNLILGSLAVITLPAFLVPFSGLGIMFIRAYSWGLIFSPLGNKTDALNVPHLVTMLIEGQAFIVAGLGDWLLAKRFIGQFKNNKNIGETKEVDGKPLLDENNEKSKNIKSENEYTTLVSKNKEPIKPKWFNPLTWSWPGYKQGLKENLILYAPITGILTISALWEAYEVIHLRKWLIL